MNQLRWQQAVPTGIADALIWIWFLQTAYLSRFTDQAPLMRDFSQSLPFLATGIAVAINVILMGTRWNAIPMWYRMACSIGSTIFTGCLLITNIFIGLDPTVSVIIYSLFVVFYCGSQILRTETLAKSPNFRTLMLSLVVSLLTYYGVSALLLLLPLAAYNLVVTILPLALLYRTLRPLQLPLKNSSPTQSFFNIPTLLLVLFGISGGLITSTGGSNPAITLTGLFSMPDPMHLIMVLANLGLGILAATAANAPRGMYFAFMNLIWMAGTYLGAALLHVLPPIPTTVLMILAGTIGLAIIVSFLIDRKMWLGKEDYEAGKEPPKEEQSQEEYAEVSSASKPLEDKVSKLAEENNLTRRESEILKLLLEGRSVPIICDRLIISEGTARTHVKHIYQKLEVHNRQELLDLAEK